MCKKGYKQTKEHIEKRVLKKTHIPEDVWNKINIQNSDECWIWQGYKDKDGYGAIDINKKIYKAHRLIYELSYGSIPKGKLVCHICDNPPCCNPHHLFLGTNKDNSEDRDNKKRQFSKLKYSQVEEIRKLYSTGKYLQRELGEMYGVSRVCITNLLNYTRWNRGKSND